MVHRVEKRCKNSERVDILFGGSQGDRVLPRITWKRSYPRIYEWNYKFLGGDEDGKNKFHVIVF